MEKKPRAGAAGDEGGTRGEASGSSESWGLVERLPEALLVEVLGRLEVDDACSAAASCRALHGAASAAISAITTIDLSVRLPSPAPPRRTLANGSTLNVGVCSLPIAGVCSVQRDLEQDSRGERRAPQPHCQLQSPRRLRCLCHREG